jgi:hypothetical protein
MRAVAAWCAPRCRCGFQVVAGAVVEQRRLTDLGNAPVTIDGGQRTDTPKFPACWPQLLVGSWCHRADRLPAGCGRHSTAVRLDVGGSAGVRTSGEIRSSIGVPWNVSRPTKANCKRAARQILLEQVAPVGIVKTGDRPLNFAVSAHAHTALVTGQRNHGTGCCSRPNRLSTFSLSVLFG